MGSFLIGRMEVKRHSLLYYELLVLAIEGGVLTMYLVVATRQSASVIKVSGLVCSDMQ